MRRALIFIFAVLFYFGPHFFPPSVQAKELLVGMNLALSGGAAPVGLGLLRACELAAEKINAEGGIKVGRDSYIIKLIPYDNRYDAKEAVSIANKLIYSDKVKYIITMGGTCCIAVNPLITENKILHPTYTYGGKKVTHPNAPYTFRCNNEPAQAHEALFPWIVKKYGLKNAAIISPDDETGILQAEDLETVAKKLGITITDKTFAPRNTLDFIPMLTKIKAKNPDAIDFGSWGGSEGPLACKQAHELGYKGLYIFSYTQSIPTFEKVAKDYMDGVLFYNIFSSDPTTLATMVAKRYEEKYGQKFDPLVWRAYDILFVVKKGIEIAGAIDTTAVKNAMAKVEINGVFGRTKVGGKSYYGINTQFIFPMPLSIFDGKQQKFVELYRGTLPEDY